MTHLDLFSGIGGFALAAEGVWPNIEHTFCEIDPFCQAVLKKHWPTSKIYGDIRKLHLKHSVDLVTGGFPCQPFSLAGRRRGNTDDRFLWPEMLRVIAEAQPCWIVGENVAGIISMELDRVCTDLEAQGYEVWPFVIPACATGAPHRRDRVWVVGHADRNDEPNGSQHEEVEELPSAAARTHADPECLCAQRGKVKRTKRQETSRKEQLAGFQQFSVRTALSAARIYRKRHGVSSRLDIHRNKALGNAIVPQVAGQIFKAIKATTK